MLLTAESSGRIHKPQILTEVRERPPAVDTSEPGHPWPHPRRTGAKQCHMPSRVSGVSRPRAITTVGGYCMLIRRPDRGPSYPRGCLLVSDCAVLHISPFHGRSYCIRIVISVISYCIMSGGVSLSIPGRRANLYGRTLNGC